MSVRWTKRRNGRTMATLRLEAHVDRILIAWICEHTGWGEAKALTWYKEQLQVGLSDRGQWYTPALVDGELIFLHVDGIKETLAEGGEVYEG